MGKKQILIVEDNELISEQLKFFLGKYNFNCEIIDTGESAIDFVRNNPPDLILMDIRLAGDINGIETTRRIKQFIDLPVIFLTSHTETEIIDECISTDPAGFVSKTISHAELKIQIDYSILKYQKHREQSHLINKLQKSRSKYENIFNSSRDAIFYSDIDFKINFWNPSAERIFGYSYDEVIGRKLTDLILRDAHLDLFIYEFNRWISEELHFSPNKIFSIYATDANGREFSCELSLGLIKSENEVSICGFAKDVSERVIADEEMTKLIEELQINKEIIEQNASELMLLNSKLLENEAQLKELNRSKDRFFSIIAHDLKGPFQGLLGYSQILSRDLKLLSIEEISDLAKNLHQSANQLFKLLENLLSWTRLQRGKIERTPINFDLELLVNQNIELNTARAKQKEIDLLIDIKPNTFVFADVNMVNTIIRNLISNALKFTYRGGSITIRTENISNEEVEIQVIDTGIGIQADKIDCLFRIDSYYTTPGTENEEGTGLGLVLCKELVEKNMGSIFVDSVLGKGTKFIITLPKGVNPD